MSLFDGVYLKPDVDFILILTSSQNWRRRIRAIILRLDDSNLISINWMLKYTETEYHNIKKDDRSYPQSSKKLLKCFMSS